MELISIYPSKDITRWELLVRMSWDNTLSINTDNTRACLGVVSAAVVSSVDIASAVFVFPLNLPGRLLILHRNSLGPAFNVGDLCRSALPHTAQ